VRVQLSISLKFTVEFKNETSIKLINSNVSQTKTKTVRYFLKPLYL